MTRKTTDGTLGAAIRMTLSRALGHSAACLAPLCFGRRRRMAAVPRQSAIDGRRRRRVPANLKLLWTYEAGDAIESSAAIAEGVGLRGRRNPPTCWPSISKPASCAGSTKPRKASTSRRPLCTMASSTWAILSGMLHAVRAADGKGLWTFKTESEIKSSPVVAGDRVFIGSYDGNLYCLSARDGKLLWKYTTHELRARHAVHRQRRHLPGRLRRSLPRRAPVGRQGSAALPRRRVHRRVARDGGASAPISARSTTMWWARICDQKRIVWRYENPARQFPFYSSAAASGDRVVLGGRDKLVHCLNAKTGKPFWTFATKARVDSSPAIAGGRVYIGSNDGHFYVLDLATGKKLWDFEAGAPLSASPAIADGRIVIGSQDGRLYCFGKANQ